MRSLPFARKARKGKKNIGGVTISHAGKKKDLSKVKCFACHKNGHYVS